MYYVPLLSQIRYNSTYYKAQTAKLRRRLQRFLELLTKHKIVSVTATVVGFVAGFIAIYNYIISL